MSQHTIELLRPTEEFVCCIWKKRVFLGSTCTYPWGCA